MYLFATFRLPTANFIRHGHVTLTMSARDQKTVIGRWKVIGPRISVHIQLASLRIYRLTHWVVLFSDDLLCLRSWHRTNDMILFCHVIRYGWLVVSVAKSFRSARSVLLLMDSTFFCAPLVSLHNSGLFLQCTYCCIYGTESCRHTHLSGQG